LIASPNEIPAFAPLRTPIDLSGKVVSADALHTQRNAAKCLVGNKGGDYLSGVERNQRKPRNAAVEASERMDLDRPEYLTCHRCPWSWSHRPPTSLDRTSSGS
jgi:hypothetical protein